MILLFGWGSDSALARTAETAARLGADVVLVDQETLAGHDLHDGVLTVPGGRVSLADLPAAYARPLAVVASPGSAAYQREERVLGGIVTWLDVADARIVNRPRAMHSNSSKPFQAQLIARAGFEVPESLVTNDPDEVLAFAERVGPLVFKSVSGIRSIVRRVDEGYADRLERVRALPTQFQALVEGEDVRVHVVGSAVFATRIRSAATDYRYAGRDGHDAELTATELPDAVAQRCVDLAAVLGLPLVGIDLRETPDGRFVCFEANPMPGYSYFESHTGQPISDALVRHLTGRTEVS
jgi:glutathione synthase/RimK-type ligase-like ATP-grasp enzyme